MPLSTWITSSSIAMAAAYVAFEGGSESAEGGRSHGQPEEVCGWAGGGQVSGLPLRSRTSAVATCPRPKTKKEVRQFLGLAGYYRRSVHNYSDLTSPLTDLTKKEAPDPVPWTELC